MRTWKAVLPRLGVTTFDSPFRDFDTFYKRWRRVGASGSGGEQARRDVLDEHFDPRHALLDEREAGSITSTLATTISARKATGWPRVDEGIAEFRRYVESASPQQDYSNVGNDCVAILEALSAAVYVHDRQLVGTDNAELRRLARAAIEFAQAVKHRTNTVSRTEAGIVADAVILLANILRRIQPPT